MCVCAWVRACGEGRGATITDRYVHQSVECQYKSQFLVAEGNCMTWYSIISIKSIQKGLGKLLLNEDAIAADLEKNWAVVAEGIQTILRRENYPNPYETLKELTRTNQKINEKTIADFIETLNVDEKVKAELRAIKPSTYTGIYK